MEHFRNARRGKWEISEKTRRPAIPICESPGRQCSLDKRQGRGKLERLCFAAQTSDCTAVRRKCAEVASKYPGVQQLSSDSPGLPPAPRVLVRRETLSLGTQAAAATAFVAGAFEHLLPTARAADVQFGRLLTARGAPTPRTTTAQVLPPSRQPLTLADMVHPHWETPRKSRRPAVSSGMIPTCENAGVARPGIEPARLRAVYNDRDAKTPADLPRPPASVMQQLGLRNDLCPVALSWFEIRSEIGSKVDTENFCTIRVQSWTGDRNEVYFELPKLAVPNLDLRSAAIVNKCSLKIPQQIELPSIVFSGN
ncbi:hypothetical protein PR048_030488 [Dryococelus australis]|uniref:Uncharacterized protein n=1 Tax=Dryococelus australis TaxID=614101 RepID=A0ABQ9GBT9_9NEOP|nr:hypothetical protein PR048_030488 [Dryococelus australis]